MTTRINVNFSGVIFKNYHATGIQNPAIQKTIAEIRKTISNHASVFIEDSSHINHCHIVIINDMCAFHCDVVYNPVINQSMIILHSFTQNNKKITFTNTIVSDIDDLSCHIANVRSFCKQFNSIREITIGQRVYYQMNNFVKMRSPEFASIDENVMVVCKKLCGTFKRCMQIFNIKHNLHIVEYHTDGTKYGLRFKDEKDFIMMILTVVNHEVAIEKIIINGFVIEISMPHCGISDSYKINGILKAIFADSYKYINLQIIQKIKWVEKSQ